MLYTLSGMFFSPLLTWINFIYPSDLCSNITSSWQPPWTSPTKKILCIICFHSTDHVHPSIWWWTTDVCLSCYNITSISARILSVFIHQHYDHSAHCFLLQFPDLDHLGNGNPHTRKMKMKPLILRTTVVRHWAGGRRWDGWSGHYLVRNVSPGCKLGHGFVLLQNVIDLHTILSPFKGLTTQFYSALCLFLVGLYECPPFTTLLMDYKFFWAEMGSFLISAAVSLIHSPRNLITYEAKSNLGTCKGELWAYENVQADPLISSLSLPG